MTGTRGQRIRDNGICLALLLILPLAVHLSSWLNNTVSQDGAVLQELPPWKGDVTVDPTPGSSLSAWQLRTVWPAYRFLNDNQDALPALQWNPEIALGVPFMANADNRVFSAFSIVFYLFSLDMAMFLSIVAKGVVAGWVAYYVARRYGFTAWYALIAALIFQWSGALFIWGLEPLGDSLVWLPLLVLATDRLILGQFKSWPGVALVVAVMALSGGLRALSASLAVMFVYMILRRLRDPKHAHVTGALPGFALGALAGAGLAAIQLLPYAEMLREGNAIDHTYPWPFEPSLLLGLFGPGYYFAATDGNNPLVHVVFIGVVPLLFIGLWASLRRLIDKPIRHRVESLTFATVLVASVPVLLQELLPGIHVLRFLQPVHYLAGLSFPLALLVAGAVEAWLHLNAEQCKRALARMGMVLPLFWGGLLVAFLVFSRGEGGGFAINWPTFWVFTLTVLTLAILFGATVLYPKPRIMIVGILVLLAGTTYWGTVSWQFKSPRASLFPPTDVVQALQGADERVGGSSRMARWPLGGNQIPALYAPSTVELNRTRRFLDQVDANPLLQRRASVGTLLLQKEDILGSYAPVRADLNIIDVFDSGLILFRDNGALPRYRIAHDVVNPAGADSPLDVAGPPRIAGIVLPPLSGAIKDTIRVADVPRNNRLELEVETTHPGVLVVSEAWYPGWQARLDGSPVPILPVDGAFRGVELGAGSHTVSFQYHSASLRWGALISLGFLAFFLVGAYLASRRPKPRY